MSNGLFFRYSDQAWAKIYIYFLGHSNTYNYEYLMFVYPTNITFLNFRIIFLWRTSKCRCRQLYCFYLTGSQTICLGSLTLGSDAWYSLLGLNNAPFKNDKTHYHDQNTRLQWGSEDQTFWSLDFKWSVYVLCPMYWDRPFKDQTRTRWRPFVRFSNSIQIPDHLASNLFLTIQISD